MDTGMYEYVFIHSGYESQCFSCRVCVCVCLADTPDRRISVTLTQHRFVIWKWFRNLVIYDKWVCIPQKQTRWNPKSIYMHFVRLPAHLSPHAWGRARSPRAPLFHFENEWLMYPYRYMCIYLFYWSLFVWQQCHWTICAHSAWECRSFCSSGVKLPS